MMVSVLAGVMVLIAVALVTVPLLSGKAPVLFDKKRGKLSPWFARWGLASLLALALVLLTFGLYRQLGASTELAVARLLSQADTRPDQLRQALAQWVARRPNNPQALFLLGRHDFSQGHIDQAVETFRILYRQSERNPRVSAELAQALFLQANNTLTDEVRRLYQEALSQEPGNTTALGLKGIDAFGQQRYRVAVQAWQDALSRETDPVARQALATGIVKARGLSGESLSLIRVQLAISSQVKQLPADTRVMVFARASGTRNPPVAVTAVTLASLPGEVVLDDRTAMMMGASLSEAGLVDVYARISLSGDIRQADYQAVATAVRPSENARVELTLGSEG